MTRPWFPFQVPPDGCRGGNPPVPPEEPRRFFRHRPPYRWPYGEFGPSAPPFHRRDRYPFRFRFGCLIPLFFLLSGAGCLAALAIAYFHSLFPDNFPRGGFLVPLLGLVLFALVVGAILSRAVNPLDEVMEAADRVASGDYSARLRERGPAQVRAFMRSFNTMTARLQAYDEQRKRMLADISHELRTPLTVLQGNLEGMLDHVYPRDEEHISLLLEETRILSRLIDDLRTFSLAETGRLVLQKESCDPARLVSDLVQAMQSSAAKAGVTLSGRPSDGLPAVEMDAARIREVLENLVANAIRHTPAGGSISVLCRRDPDRGPRLEFRVEDNGAGIPEDLLPHVFDRYVKSVDSGGTGLGLAIAKRLVEAHGGKIEAESRPGSGTVIRFWIPI